MAEVVLDRVSKIFGTGPAAVANAFAAIWICRLLMANTALA